MAAARRLEDAGRSLSDSIHRLYSPDGLLMTVYRLQNLPEGFEVTDLMWKLCYDESNTPYFLVRLRGEGATITYLPTQVYFSTAHLGGFIEATNTSQYQAIVQSIKEKSLGTLCPKAFNISKKTLFIV